MTKETNERTPEEIAEARKKVKEFMRGFQALHLPNDAPWFYPRADILLLVGECFKFVRMTCQSQDWPELFAFMREATGKSDDELMEDVRMSHLAFVDFLAWIGDPNHVGVKDKNYKEALNRIGWNDLPVHARTITLTQLGLFLMAETWICGRQREMAMLTNQTMIGAVAQGVLSGVRCTDQGVSETINAMRLLRNAVLNAMQAGCGEDSIKSAVGDVLSNPDLSTLSTTGLMEVSDDEISRRD